MAESFPNLMKTYFIQEIPPTSNTQSLQQNNNETDSQLLNRNNESQETMRCYLFKLKENTDKLKS
jgi:hypothetical protein